LPDRFHIIPWETETFKFAFSDEKQIEEPIAQINAMVDKIDKEDPWVLRTFKIKGNGEGLVFYPISLADKDGFLDAKLFEAFGFKAKGEAHRVIATDKAVSAKPATSDSAEKFAELMLPDARLQQGAKEVGGFDTKLVVKFLEWIKKDVEKEGKDELAASKLEWKAVHPFITTKARTWFLEAVKKAAGGEKKKSESEDAD